jgi:hypothetical protein
MAPALLLLMSVLDTGVSVSFPPTPLPKALSILSVSIGQRLEAAAPLKDEVLVARLKDAPKEKVLKLIGETFTAKWETGSDGVMRLVPDVKALRQKEIEKRAADLALLKGSMDYVRRRLAEQPKELDAATVEKYKQKLASDENRRKAAAEAQDWSRAFTSSGAAEESPAWRAAARIIPLIGLERMLAMPNDAREVWAERPTAMQHPFPPAAGTVLSQYRRELQLLNPSLDVARVRLVFKKWEMSAALNVHLQGMGPLGKVVDTAFVRMNNDSDQLKIPYDVRSKVDPKAGEKPLTFAEEVRENRVVMDTDTKGMDSVRRTLMKKWRPRLLDPVTYEPTKNFQGATMLAIAEALDKNLIGTVFDLTNSREASTNITPTQALAKLRTLLRESEDGWLIAKPDEDLARTSRHEARQFLQTCARLGGVPVDEAARWTATSKDRWPFIRWTGDYLAVLLRSRGAFGVTSTLIDSEDLRLWWSLGETARQTLRRGDTLALSRLTPDAKSLLSKSVYWFEALGEGEPTELLPTGINDGTVSLKITEKPVFYGWAEEDGEPEEGMPWDAAVFGKFLGVGNTWWELPAEHYRRFNRFRMGTFRTYNLKFVLQPGSLPMDVELTETFFDPTGQPVTKLGPALAAEVEKARVAALAKPATENPARVIPPL